MNRHDAFVPLRVLTPYLDINTLRNMDIDTG